MQRLKDKVAIITGGNSGIGEGVARHFHQEGAKVVILGRNSQTLADVKKALNNDILTVQGDVTNTDDIKKLYETTLNHFGKIDALIVNSGVGERKHFTEVQEKDFDYMVDTNYRGAFFTVRYALDYLNAKASIVLIASAAAHVTVRNHSIYGSAKAAIVKLAKHLAFDLGEKNIRINCISPGYIKTPIFDSRLKTDPDYLTRREPIIPLKRIGTPKDIAHAALFLASDEASYITGADLLVDGGYCSSFQEPN